MTLANILIGLGLLTGGVLGWLVADWLFERVRAARWRRIREPRCYGDEGGHPKPWKAGD